MPQIMKKKKSLTALAGVGALASAGLLGVENASADTVVSATTAGAGNDVISDTSNTPNQSIVNLLNSQIRNVQTESNGMIQITSEPKVITSADVTNAQTAITKLSDLVRQYNSLKDQLNTQNASNERLNGMAGADNTQTVTGGTLDQSVTNLQDLVAKMQSMVDSNSKILADNANNKSQSSELNDKVTSANTTITDAASDLKNYKNGIVGDMDDVNRKSQDSANANGIVVDNSKTQQVNTVTTNATIKSDKTQVTSLTDADKNLQRILDDINKQNQANVQQSLNAANYRANALSNIDDINTWLKTQQTTAEKAKEDSKAATTSITTMDEYKTSMIAKLNEAMSILKADKASQKMIDQVQKAIDQVNASGIATEALPAVGQKDPIEFGDIGQKQDVSNGAQDDTIANTKTTEADKMATAIKNGVAQVQASNTAAMNKITPTIDSNNKAIDDYLQKLKTNGAGSQVGQDFLDNMQIYNSNYSAAIKNYYKNYMDKAISQTSEDVSKTQSQIANSGTISHVTGEPTIGQVSAAMYAQNAGTMDAGFGSVMLSNTDINKLVSGLSVTSGSTIYADSRSDGGSKNIYNALVNMYGHEGTPGGYANLPALQDLKNQYLSPGDGQEAAHAAQTLTIVTNSPSLYVTLPNSFVYADGNGNIKTADTKVTVSATAYDGTDITSRLKKASQISKDTIYALYVYNFQVNPYTGQLVAGVSYIAMGAKGTTTGGGSTGGGGGEGMRLSAASKSVKSLSAGQAMNLGYDGIGSPILDQGIANGIGLAQTIQVQIDPNNKEAVGYAVHAPLYVSDIDDGQQLIAYTTGNDAKIVTAAGQGEQTDTSDWTDPFHIPGRAISMTAHNTDQTNATTNKTTTIDGQSAAVYNVNGNNTQVGLSNSKVTMRSQGDAVTRNYMSIDTALFAPFGVIGQPQLSMDQINAMVKTLEVNVPTAKAETAGSYDLTSNIEYMYAGDTNPETPQNITGDLTLPSYVAAAADEAQVSSNTSMVVKQKDDITKLTASGNSLVTKTTDNNKKTSSGNSLVIHSTTTSTKTSSGNSLVIRTTTPVGVVTGSGNSPVVKTIAQAAKEKNEAAMKLTSATPTVTKNTDGTHDVTLSVYVDPALETTAENAMNSWVSALKNQGVNLKVSYTTDVNKLKDGVTIAILDANDSSELTSSAQADETMSGLGGWSTAVENDILTPDGDNDKFNASGTVTAGDALRNSLFTIQLNREGLSTQAFKNALMGGKLDENVLKHELGHVFGLEHSLTDSLMSPNVSDTVFSGVVSNTDAYEAAENLITSPGKSKVFSSTGAEATA